MRSISVVMPVKNGALYLPDSITDIESNVLPSDEIIVIDDGSSDKTPVILRDWAHRNQNVQVITIPSLGLVNALNLGISQANNNWIARFDVDDRYARGRLAHQRRVINDRVSAIFCDYEFFDGENRNLGKIPGPVLPSATATSLISSQRTPHPGVMLNREAVLDCGGYREEDFPAEDISLWLRIAKTGSLISVPHVLLSYRLSKGSISAQNRAIAKTRTAELLMEIGINSEAVRFSVDNWEQIFSEYSLMSFADERKLLFLRDLRQVLKSGLVSNLDRADLIGITHYLTQRYSTFGVIAKLGFEKLKRKKFRNS